MESESPEKSQLRFSEKRGLLVYEGEFSPDFPLGLSGAVPLRSATWGGNTRLADSAPSARERTLRNKRLARRGVGSWTTTAVPLYFVSWQEEAMGRRKNVFSA